MRGGPFIGGNAARYRIVSLRSVRCRQLPHFLNIIFKRLANHVGTERPIVYINNI